MLHAQTSGTLEEQLNSALFLPGTAEYENARSVWNATIDRRPAGVVPCRTAADVATAVSAASDHDLRIAVRGGGHNIAGTAVADDSLMIDLTPMRRVEVIPDARIAQVEGGATWASVDSETQKFGLATPGGVVSSTGVGGLTLGGGFGWLSRRHGLAVDNLLEVEIVLADGCIVRASTSENTDLFWAIRGGGGNFGVVTRLNFRLHEVGPQVLFGPTFFQLDDAATVLTAYAEKAPDLSRSACVWANLMTAPPVPVLPEEAHGSKVLTLMQFFDGDPNEGRALLAELYGGVRPLGSALAPRPFVEAQGFLDPVYEFGARNYWRSHNHRVLSPGLIETLVELTPALPTSESELLICQLGGAISDVTPDATAFPHRQIPFLSTPGVRWHDAGDDVACIGWLKEASARIAAHAEPGAYVNFIAETQGPMQTPYGDNLARLTALKRRFDPENRFSSNQNIQPAA